MSRRWAFGLAGLALLAGGCGSPPTRVVTDFAGFTSPDGNIGCYIDSEYVRCDIDKRTWKPPVKPKSCDLDYGQGILLDGGGAAGFVCAGDTALRAGKPLESGQTIKSAHLRCRAEDHAIDCSYEGGVHGFLISRTKYLIR